MYRRCLISLSIVLSLGWVTLPCAADVVKITVNDTINPIAAEYIGRAIQGAEKTHADALLIDIDTPGGLASSTRDIVQLILASKVPVIVYVTPAGGYAASAGFYILESADVAAMAPGTNTGSAHPVLFGTTMDPVLKEKLENDSAALLRSYTEKRGRNPEVAETAVRQSKSFSADEALNKHLIEYIAKDQNDLFRQLDGKTITLFDGSKVVLHLLGKPIQAYDPTLREQVLSMLMNPNTAFIIFALGLMALYVEFNHPGAIVPGVIGFICVLLALFAFHILPTSYFALVLIVGAFVLFALEAKFQSHGVLTIGGIAIMVLGAMLLVNGPIPEMRVKLITALSVSIPLGLITTFLMTIVVKARRNKIATGQEGMIGEIGVVEAALTPAGKVLVHGELWDAIAPATVEAGRNVVVRKVQDLKLYVEPSSSGERPPG